VKWWVWVLIAVSVGATAFGLLRPRGEQGTAVNVATASPGDFVREVRATGSIEAKLYNLTFSRPGRVVGIQVKEGQAVVAGQVLAVLDTANEQAQLQTAKKTLQALQSRVGSSQSDLQTNRARLQNQLTEVRKNLELNRSLLAIGSASQNEVNALNRQATDLTNQLATLAQTAQASRQDLGAQIQARTAEIATLERSIAQSSLRTPVSGTVSSVTYLVGVETGVGSAIRVVESGSLRIQARLSEADIAGVQPGQPVRIELDSSAGKFLQGKVERLGVQAEVAGTGGSATLPIFVRFLEDATLAKPGLTATLRITTLRLRSAVRIPLEALIEDNGYFVWVVKDFKVKKERIAIRARNLTQAAVEGLPAGATIVSLPPETLKDGTKVSYVVPQPKP
jgi:HlyD family secretion protein